MTGRLLLLLGPLAGFVILPATALAAPSPSPSPPPLRSVQISGGYVSKPITVHSDRDPEREADLRAEVSWVANLAGVAVSPAPDKLGPKFTMVLSIGGKATEQYELYPLAAGGPRIYRPAEQPDKRKPGEGWFYGRLSMPTTLMSAGVPMTGVPADPGSGDGGAGGGAPASEPPDLEGLLGNWRNFMGLNLAVIILVAAGVFSLAFVLRRRV